MLGMVKLWKTRETEFMKDSQATKRLFKMDIKTKQYVTKNI